MSTKVVRNSARPKPPAAGKGRPKGALNKTTKALKEMILGALDEVGGQSYLVEQALKENPGPFLALIAKVLPLQIAGDANAPITIKVVTVTSEEEQAKAWKPPT